MTDFNIAFLGPSHIYECRRDFILLLQYTLEELGHRVSIAPQLDSASVNLVFGTYFHNSATQVDIANSPCHKILINTEVVSQEGLNFNPNKTDFYGAYLPCAKLYDAIWDVIQTNIQQWELLGFNNVKHLPWAWSQKLDEIPQLKSTGDLDFYFYGMPSPRRQIIIKQLMLDGLIGRADGYCPYFQRNYWISRAKVILNLRQDEKYTHVNSFRIGYLKNNHKCIVTEAEQDTYGYLKYTAVVDDIGLLATRMRQLIDEGAYYKMAANAYESFSQIKMTDVISELMG